MPELPEVQTIINDLVKQGLIGLKIVDLDILWPPSIDDQALPLFRNHLTGQTILSLFRVGKYIVFQTENWHLLIHLRMSGRLVLGRSQSPHVRVRFLLSPDQVLEFIDPRKFGRIHLLKDPKETFNRLGIDALSAQFTPLLLEHLLKGKNLRIKPLLLDQTLLSGLGNIYADEALWEAKIHPERLASELQSNEFEALYFAIQKVLGLALLHGGTSLGTNQSNFHSSNGKTGTNLSNLKVYQRNRLPCPRCKQEIRKIVLAGRGTHFCPVCQKQL